MSCSTPPRTTQPMPFTGSPGARTRRPGSRLPSRRVAARHLRRSGTAARVSSAGPGSTVARPADPGGGPLAFDLDRLRRRGFARDPGGPHRHARSPSRRVRVRRCRPPLRVARGVVQRARRAYASAPTCSRRAGSVRPSSCWREDRRATTGGSGLAFGTGITSVLPWHAPSLGGWPSTLLGLRSKQKLAVAQRAFHRACGRAA